MSDVVIALNAFTVGALLCAPLWFIIGRLTAPADKTDEACPACCGTGIDFERTQDRFGGRP